MAELCRINGTAAAAACDAITALINAGGAAGVVICYSGAQPATCAEAATGSEVFTTTAVADMFANASTSTGIAALNAALQDPHATGGTAGYFRLVNGTPTPILQGTVGTATSNLILNTVTIGAGSVVDITALTVTVPLTQ
jgi:hypothetical protein